MSQTLHEFVYRPLTPADEPRVRELCAECFPITYPDRWYSYITSDKVFSLSAWVETGSNSSGDNARLLANGSGLVGMLVAEVQGLDQLEGEGTVALEHSEADTTAMYVISLGVTKRYRRHGIGRYLMASLLEHVTSILSNCWAVYLHVVSSNTIAIDFYHGFGFINLMSIPGYYTISQRPQDGLLLIRYVNGGVQFSHSFSAYFRRYVTESSSCRIITSLFQILGLWFTKILSRNRSNSMSKWYA